MTGKKLRAPQQSVPMGEKSKVVFANGCFDILHAGHIKLLQICVERKRFYDSAKLIIGIDSDEKIKKDKGAHRPYFNLEERITHLKIIFPQIDDIMPFNTNEELELIIKKHTPEMIKGSNWLGNVVGEKWCKNIFWVSTDLRLPSTSEIVQRVEKQQIKRLRQMHPGADIW